MHFTLTYQGVLPPSGNATVKQAIRETLHAQMTELWQHAPLSDHRDLLVLPDDRNPIGVLRRVDEHYFAPVVTKSLHLTADLDILLLRAESPGGIIVGRGDIDNRLKTLFDALRAPVSKQEVKEGARASTPDAPLHVLLEDDDLVTRVSVETDRWLSAPAADQVLVILKCTTMATRAIYGNVGLG